MNSNADSSICPDPANRPAALVTGGGVRLGLAIVTGLHEAGYDVAAHYNSSDEGLATLVRQALPNRPRIVPLRADFTQRRAPNSLAAGALQALGRLDLLVNSAAVMLGDDADTVALAKMKLINVDAPAALVDALVDALAQRQGSIVNIADVAALHSFAGHLSYSRSKAVLVSRTKQWALQFAQRGVRVNALCPGTVLPAPAYTGSRLEALCQSIPLRRIGEPEDVVRAVVFLARSPFVTGQVLCVDGGRALAAQNAERTSTAP
ncbi:MAG: SDR family oxidoreductase [Myxococcota bacterium]|nr:SDR family oxidoreductase [Myxococcota bacterium]